MPARLSAVSVQMPSEIRENSWWRKRYPEMVESAEQRALARVFSNSAPPDTAFTRAMQRFEKDPFRGACRRRFLGPDEDSTTLEICAGRAAMDAAEWGPEDVDLVISTGFIPTHLAVGNAVHVAGGLEVTGAAFNIESACGGPITALNTAFALVRAGAYRRVLVTTSVTYSTRASMQESLSWFLGDGAGAFAVEAGGNGAALLGGTTFHTADTCGTWFMEIENDAVVMRAHPKTGRVMAATAEPHLRRAMTEALASAGLEQKDIDFYVVHTPTAWFADFAAEAFDFPRDRTLCTYAEYTNIGPALTPANLHRAAATGRIDAGDRVLVMGPGSSGSTGALVFEWGDVALGPVPAGLQ